MDDLYHIELPELNTCVFRIRAPNGLYRQGQFILCKAAIDRYVVPTSSLNIIFGKQQDSSPDRLGDGKTNKVSAR